MKHFVYTCDHLCRLYRLPISSIAYYKYNMLYTCYVQNDNAVVILQALGLNASLKEHYEEHLSRCYLSNSQSVHDIV